MHPFAGAHAEKGLWMSGSFGAIVRRHVHYLCDLCPGTSFEEPWEVDGSWWELHNR